MYTERHLAAISKIDFKILWKKKLVDSGFVKTCDELVISLLCGNHFVSGKPTDDPGSVDFVPSLFPTNHITNPKTQKDQDRFERVKKRQTSNDTNDDLEQVHTNFWQSVKL